MKLNRKIALICLLGLAACRGTQNGSTEGAEPNTPQYFSDAASAASQARQDLIAVLKADKDIHMNIDATALETAREDNGIEALTVDFEALMRQDTLGASPAATSAGRSYIPFVAEGRVIATASIRKDDKGFSISALGNDQISKDLQVVRAATQNTGVISVYEVPNLNALIYEVNQDGKTVYFTEYRNLFSLQEGTSWGRIALVLQKDAVEFQQKYGELIKKERLVK